MTTEASSIEEPATPHEAARLLASVGYHVVPIKEGGKHPPIADWWNAATTSHDMIDAWYTGLYATAGVGIATGYNNIFVLDVDVGEGKNGDETLRDLELAYTPIPESVEQQTGSGGRHIFLRAPDGIEIRNDHARRLGPGLDIRGVGGQVVCAPTIHPNGKPYIWLLASAPWEREVADAPGWLIELLTKEDLWSTNSNLSTSKNESAPSVSADGKARGSTTTTPPSTPTSAIDGATSRPGDRFNQTTTWEHLLTTDGWTRQRNGRDGEQRWTRPGKPGKDGISATVDYKASDLLKVFTSSVPTLRQDATYSRFGYWAATRHGGDHAAAARALAALEPAERIDPATLIGTFPTVNGEANETAEEVAAEATNPYLAALLDWHALYAREPRELESWDGDGLLIKGRHTALVAKGGDGKSLLAVDILARLVTQPDGPRVLYVDWEMGEDDVYTRAVNLGYQADQLQGRLEYAHLPIANGLDTPAGAEELLAAVRALGVQIVVLDTYSRAVIGEENDADTVRSLYKNFSLPLRAMGIDQFRLDHLGKEATKGARGSSAKNDDVDQVWQLAANGKGVNLTLTKNRANSKVQELHYLRRDDPLRHECVDGPVRDDVNMRLLRDLEDLEPLSGLNKRDLEDFLKARGVAPGDAQKIMPTYRLYVARRDQTKAVSEMVGPNQTKAPNQEPENQTSRSRLPNQEPNQTEVPHGLVSADASQRNQTRPAQPDPFGIFDALPEDE